MLIPGHLFCSGMERYLNTWVWHETLSVFLQKNKQICELCGQMSMLGENNNNNVCRTEILLQAGRPPWNENRFFIHNCALSLIYIEVFLLMSLHVKSNATSLGCSSMSKKACMQQQQRVWRTFRSHFRNEEKTFVIRACEFFYARAKAKRFKCVSWYETTHIR